MCSNKAICGLVSFLETLLIYSKAYINVTSQGKLKRFKIRDHEEKKDDVNSSKKSLDKETELVKRKLEEDKARKRTRGPYRKSNVN